MAEVCRSLRSFSSRRAGGRGAISIHHHQSPFLQLRVIICAAVCWLRLLSKEMMRLKSTRCEFSSLQHISGGLSCSYAINCGGVLSISMNNLRRMLIGIPVLAKGTETECC